MPDNIKLDLSFLNDPSLSWAAKGLYCWLLTQSQGTPVEDALAISWDGEELERALAELTQMGTLSIGYEMIPGFGDGRVHEA